MTASQLPLRLLLLLLAIAFAAPVGASAQVVQGWVIDHETARPLAGAHVRLLDDDGVVYSAFSDDDGHFELVAPTAGSWRISAQLLGYATTGPLPVEVTHEEPVIVELSLAVEPLVMEDLMVVVPRRHVNVDVQRFHRRREHGERTGMGYFLYGEELEERGFARPTDVLRSVPGVRAATASVTTGRQIVQMRAGCIPDVYLDGMPVNRANPAESLDTYVNTRDIEGIEVYRGSAGAPGYYDADGCGTILVWTENPALDSDEPSSWTRWAIGIGAFLGMWFISS